jgi:hypothetical protein
MNSSLKLCVTLRLQFLIFYKKIWSNHYYIKKNMKAYYAPSIRCEVLWVKMEEGNLGRGLLFLLWSTYVCAWKGNRKGNLGWGIFFLLWLTYVRAWKGNRKGNLGLGIFFFILVYLCAGLEGK